MNNLYYALKYPDGRLVAVDRDSGGYPYAVENIPSAWLLEATEYGLKQMKDYMRVCNSENFKLIILKVTEMPIKVT